jgi:GDPmannose 4,6-dehydratase
MHASSGILFNHESPLRGQEFVSRKITVGLAKLKHGVGGVLKLGNLNAKRDWGFAGDYVKGISLMLQQPEAADFVLATGQLHSVREFVEAAGRRLGFEITWQGSGTEERGIDAKTGRELVAVDPKFYRPAEVDVLCGDTSKARSVLGWRPSTDYAGLVEIMVDADDKRVRDGALTF